jgi:glutathione synthase/RimK-type ligase-like ATP-grasp enzyme
MGFDILLDSDHKPYLLEINDHPSLKGLSPLDVVIKSGVLKCVSAVLEEGQES